MKTTTNHRAFTLIETAIAVTLVAIGLTMALTAGQAMLANSRQSAATTAASTLNLAMSEYRTYLGQGYRADTSWTAQNAVGVWTELRKPLHRGSKVVYVLNDLSSADEVTAGLVLPRNRAGTAADYSANCIWVPLANP